MMLKRYLRLAGMISALVFMFSKNSFAQNGSVKVFSEISGISIYLDDAFKGKDLALIDSVKIGSHYLKVTKEDVIIYGELIVVKEGEETTVLIKDTPEIQEKLLATKFKEQEFYRANKLDVMLSTKYVTETTGATKTSGDAVNYFSGYYALSSKSETTTISTTFAVTDWFLVRGTTKISERTFAQITENTAVMQAYADADAATKEANLKRAKKSRAGMFVAGAVLAGLGTVILVNRDNIKNPDAKVAAIISGGVLLAGGTGMIITGAVTSTDKYNVYPGVGDLNLISFDQAVNQSKLYNQKLKKELGLPDNFEPK